MRNDFDAGLEVGTDYYWNEIPLGDLWMPVEPSEDFKKGFRFALEDLRELLSRAEKFKDPWNENQV